MRTTALFLVVFVLSAFRGVSGDANSTLTVRIVPAEAADAGARWRVNDGTGAYVSEWKASGATLQDPKLTDGDHNVEFSAVAGWQKPAAQVIFIRPGKPHALEGEYRK